MLLLEKKKRCLLNLTKTDKVMKMATTPTIENDINNLIATANSADELLPLLKTIPLKILKETLKSEILRNYPTPSHQIKLKFQALSFSHLIPDAVLQYILSFLSLSKQLNFHRQVCRKWKKLDTKNQRLFYKSFYKPYISEYQQMWIFDSRRKDNKLAAFEKRLGIKGVVDDLRKILNCAEFMTLMLKDRAVIFVHGGTQELEEQDDRGGVLTIKRNCTLVGVNYSKDQLVEVSATINGEHYDSDYNPDYTETFMCIGSYDGSGKCKVKVEGINFNNNFMSTWGHVNRGCSLSISNCVMLAQDGGITHHGDELKIDECIVEVGGICVRIGRYSNMINIRNSNLSNTYDAFSCIVFDGGYDQHDLRKLQCKGNTFISRNDDQFPIVDGHDEKFVGCLSQNNWVISSKSESYKPSLLQSPMID